MRPRQRSFGVVRQVLVKLVVLLGGDLALGPLPESAGAVHLLERRRLLRLFALPLGLLDEELDGVADVVGVARDEGLETPGFEELSLIALQVEDDGRAV